MNEREHANRRTRTNQYSAKNRSLTSGADVQGVAGEVAFARRFLGIVNYQPRSGRKGPGYSFQEQCWTIKVQTSRTPGRLMVKEGQVAADIYVLAGIKQPLRPDDVFWCGWAEKPMVERAPVEVPNRDGDYVQPCHVIPRNELRPMAELARLLAAKGPDGLIFREAKGAWVQSGNQGDLNQADSGDGEAAMKVDPDPQARLF